MVTRNELLESKEFWLVKFQAALYQQVEQYLKSKQLTKTEFATQLGVSKGYISQVLNGDFDHKLSKFIELSLAVDKVPIIKFVELEKCLQFDGMDRLAEIEDNSFQPTMVFNETYEYHLNIHVSFKSPNHKPSKINVPLTEGKTEFFKADTALKDDKYEPVYTAVI